jgi:hypothetical protein
MYTITNTYMSTRKRRNIMTSRSKVATPSAPEWGKGTSIDQGLCVFKRMLLQLHLKLALKEASMGYYERLFSPVVTLWCMIFQRLNPDRTLQAAVYDVHSGGADRLASRKEAPPSKRIRSLATTAFSKARARLPLSLLSAVLDAQAKDVTFPSWHHPPLPGQFQSDSPKHEPEESPPPQSLFADPATTPSRGRQARTISRWRDARRNP